MTLLTISLGRLSHSLIRSHCQGIFMDNYLATFPQVPSPWSAMNLENEHMGETNKSVCF